MTNHEGCIRGYHRSSKAYYAKSLVGENISVMFGMYAIEGGTTGEMRMEWVELRARLNCFEDSFSALSLFTDVIQKLGEADGDLIQEPEFCELLDDCGFKDLTAYDNPNEKKSDLITVQMTKEQAKELGLIK